MEEGQDKVAKGTDFLKTVEVEIILGKSGGARHNRDRDSDRNGPTAKSPWQKNKPTFEKKPAKTFRESKRKEGRSRT